VELLEPHHRVQGYDQAAQSGQSDSSTNGRHAGVASMSKPVKSHGLSHVAFAFTDLYRTLAFYGSVFGVKEYLRNETTVQVLGPGQFDVLAFEKRSADAGTPGGIIHFGFRLTRPEDIDSAVAAIESAGGTVTSRGEFAPGLPFAFV